MSTGYNLRRLTIKNTTAFNVQCILRRILLTSGPAKDRAIKCAELYVDDKNHNYDECFDGEGFECLPPHEMELNDATVEVSYG